MNNLEKTIREHIKDDAIAFSRLNDSLTKIETNFLVHIQAASEKTQVATEKTNDKIELIKNDVTWMKKIGAGTLGVLTAIATAIFIALLKKLI